MHLTESQVNCRANRTPKLNERGKPRIAFNIYYAAFHYKVIIVYSAHKSVVTGSMNIVC